MGPKRMQRKINASTATKPNRTKFQSLITKVLGRNSTFFFSYIKLQLIYIDSTIYHICIPLDYVTYTK